MNVLNVDVGPGPSMDQKYKFALKGWTSPPDRVLFEIVEKILGIQWLLLEHIHIQFISEAGNLISFHIVNCITLCYL